MRIPKEQDKLRDFLIDHIGKCFASRSDRQSLYDRMTRYYLWGNANGYNTDMCPYNKIQEAVDKKTSFLFSAETTQFAIDIKAEEPENRELQYLLAEKGAEAVRDAWHDAGIDLVTDDCIRWSFVWGSTFMKTFWDGGSLRSFFVDPGSIGVLDETVPTLDGQEMICMRFWEPVSRMEKIALALGRPDLLKKVSPTSTGREHGLPDKVKSLIISSGNAFGTPSPYPSGQITGAVGVPPLTNVFEKPYTLEDAVECYEFWIKEDDEDGSFKDYRVITVADPDVILFDRYAGSPSFFVEKEHPFTKITPFRKPDYFYGVPDILIITEIQDRITRRLNEIFKAMSRNLDPSWIGSGTSGMDVEKKWNKLREPGGFAFAQDPQAKFQEMSVQLPPDIWQEFNGLLGLADNLLGMSPILEGRGQTGVRSTGQTQQLAQFGASKLKKQAMLIEDSQEKLGSLILKILQKFDNTHFLIEFEDEHTQKATLAQLSPNASVKVDAHSSSPLYMNELEDKIMKLAEMKILDGVDVIDLMRIPMKAALRHKAIKKEKAAAQDKEDEKKIELLKAVSKRGAQGNR